MRAQHKFQWRSNIDDEWIINIGYINESKNFVASTSNGNIYQYSLEHLTSQPLRTIKQAHESCINKLKVIRNDTIASCSTDGVKIWDLRASDPLVGSFSNSKSSNFLSIGCQDNLVAGGTELQGNDAEIHIWDLRNTGNVVKSFVDSHHDDVTDISFHPTLSRYLMSGSTDGCVIVFDLNEKEEDDSLHQVVNFESVHACNFISERRISILSHVETFSIYELNNTDYESAIEPKPMEFGDLRSIWPNCEYVIDLNPSGYVSFGANSSKSLSLYPFNPKSETFDTDRVVNFPDAHGEEVVRDLFVVPNTPTALTCGEDGVINIWELPYQLEHFSISSGGSLKEETTQPPQIPDNVANGDKSEESKKKKKKDKKNKKHKKDKRKEVRFKPY